MTDKILNKMLERLYTSLTSGPVMNCRPHSSRQRIDLTQLARLDGSSPASICARLLGPGREAKLVGSAGPPRDRLVTEMTDEERGQRDAWQEQQTLLAKLRSIAEDAKTYEQDTGAQVLYIGLPVLNLPPDARGAGGSGSTKRVLAPIAFVPITLSIKLTRPQSVTLSCAGEGADLVIPNVALLAWIEQKTGKKFSELFADEEGSDPWREIREILERVATALELRERPTIGADTPLVATPRADDEDVREPCILPSAVLGLFPVTNQNLLRDLEALVGGEPFKGPLESFVKVGVGLGRPESASDKERRAPERLVTSADPCQTRAVRLARESTGLVVHGPPGTGKSQTITNVIGDHLARGERVLFVCDKRTALDVVLHRLTSLGFGQLCAIVHDAQRDQRDLYKSIREQLDALPDAKTNSASATELRTLDEELEKLYAKLREHHAALSERPDGGESPSLHELTGDWLALDVPGELEVIREVRGTTLAALVALEREGREVLERSRVDGYPSNVWCDALGLSLTTYLAKPVDEWRERMDTLHAAARAADQLVDPRILPFGDGDLVAEGAAREQLAKRLAPVVERLGSATVVHWATQPIAAVKKAAAAIAAVEQQTKLIAAGGADAELSLLLRSDSPKVSDLVLWVGKLAAYLAIARKWYGFLFFGRKRQALEVLQRFGLTVAVDTAQRLAMFLERERAHRILADCYEQTLAPGRKASELGAEGLLTTLADYVELFAALVELEPPNPLGESAKEIKRRLGDAGEHANLFEGMRLATHRARAIAAVAECASKSGLLSGRFQKDLAASLRTNDPILATVSALEHSFTNVEGLLRIQKALEEIPPPIAELLTKLAERGATADAGWNAVKKAVLAGQIHARIEANSSLHEMDGDRLRTYHERIHAIESRKRALVVDTVHQTWISKQRTRLLATTGSRLNGAGAEMKRRLMLRGQRAMRLRQVIAAGIDVDGGDPLFDLRPVWMASPETVAQIFPRHAIFDVVVFDEASQCRLEEALPVLTRARRVVIAGDPKQLPPTRFFESAVTQSQDTELDGTEQGLFEEQQSDTEDLLGAALNLEIEQCYLDVHYRSQNADLIEFSNHNFYDSRLQAIPGHPRNRAKVPPLKLVPIDGIYDKRVNVAEAKAVVTIVRELLARPLPPSIGIACFNLVQRDAIVDALDQAAAQDSDFASRLAAARSRKGVASFEGLFVKNLENVQGDERDHMIISTTYGPDPRGRFYRRFGPLAAAGGGRRLNVLVTRARQEVHLVTSIPREVYSSLPPVALGASPNGAWLLFSYLRYAEQLEESYREEGERLARAKVATKGTVVVRPTAVPSKIAESLAKRLADPDGLSSDVHWGNDGFCVDVALHHPTVPEDVTVGVLCDNTRFDKAEDPVEWELFRSRILAGQGWSFVRIWTPQLVREPARWLEQIKLAAQAAVTQKKEPTTRTAEGNPAIN
ncbi:MAG: DUF4011 domain-containing protein [Labilithrix sp.]|nr:DUF4011 domain-containing protein [Labilithrix sp.]